MKAKHFTVLLIACFCLAATGLYSQALFEEQILLEDFQGATCIAAADFDADGDIDFVATANDGHKVSWFENDGTQSFTEHVVVTGYTKAKTVLAAKIDNNDSYDIVASAKTLGRFSWFSNDGSGNFTEHIITESTWTSADFAYEADIDGDSDNDLVLVACDNHKIAWAKNDGNGNFTIHMLKENWIKANWATAYDLDDDLDMDILATAKAGQLIWFRNDGQETFTEQVLVDSLPGLNSVQVADFDGDGDPDLATTACDVSDQVAWYENEGAFVYTQHLLKDHYNGARASKIADLDRDGDTDILSIAWQSGFVHLWENDGAGHFTERIVCDQAYDMIQVCVTDLDLDNDPDILGACYADHEIRWWENISPFLVPDFSADSLTGHGSLHITFTDLSYSNPPVKSWSWDFNSDGTVDSYLQNPQWFIDVPGSYKVTLVVSSDSLTDTIVKPGYIRVFDGESSLEFNGSDSRMLCDQGEIPDITGPFTFEAWIMPEGFGSTGTGKIFDKTVISLFSYKSGGMVQSDSCLVLIMAHAGGVVSTVATPAGSLKLDVWHHVAVSYNDSSSSLKIFINGVEQPLEVVTPPEGPVSANGSRPIVIGNVRNGNIAFSGCIDECRLWSLERSPEEITEWMEFNLPAGQSGMKGYWKLNEGNGDTAYNLSGNGMKGRLQKLKWAQGVHLVTPSVEDEQDIRERPVIINVQPNPASGKVTFSIRSEIQGEFRAAVFNSIGGKVTDLPSFRCQRNKEYILTWDCRSSNRRSCPPGVYFLTLTTRNTTVSEKIIII